jgi:hypothetical protein
LSHFNQNPFSSKSSPLFKHFPISFLAFARDETTSVNHCITDSLAMRDGNSKKGNNVYWKQVGKKGILNCQDPMIS